MEKHNKLFNALLSNLHLVADSVSSVGGKIALEWPRRCMWWRRSSSLFKMASAFRVFFSTRWLHSR